MFHPVGSQPPSVYWRRRFVLMSSVGLLIVLMILTVRIATSNGGTTPRAAAPATHATSTPVGDTSSSPSRPATTSAAPTTSHATSSTASSASSAPSSAAPQPCDLKNLQVAAVTGRADYRVGEQPVLELQVTNTGPQPCVQDLADRQVELRVYNGESRVWGSHDCQIQPGTNDRTLEVGMPVRVAITWSGLSSEPGCAGTRQRVGAGTYTLYALLSGHTGTATQFTIS